MDSDQLMLSKALDHLEVALDILDRCQSTHGVDVHVDLAIHRLSEELAVRPKAEDEVRLSDC